MKIPFFHDIITKKQFLSINLRFPFLTTDYSFHVRYNMLCWFLTWQPIVMLAYTLSQKASSYRSSAPWWPTIYQGKFKCWRNLFRREPCPSALQPGNLESLIRFAIELFKELEESAAQGDLTLTMSANQAVRKDLLHFLSVLQKAAWFSKIKTQFLCNVGI